MPDCDASKYALQLNMYRYILSSARYGYGLDIAGMLLTSFHPALESYYCEEVSLLEREVQAIVKDLAAAPVSSSSSDLDSLASTGSSLGS